MQVKRCRFFLWHDRPIDNERAKTFINELKTDNKELAKENMLLKNENKALTKMVAELKTENGCLRKMSYAHINYEDLCDEVATLKAEVEVTTTKLKFFMLESRREAKAKNMYKLLLVVSGLILLFLAFGDDNDERKRVELLALP